MRLDGHQHFWRYTPAEYGWIDSSMHAIQRDFLPSDLVPLLKAEGLDGSIAVQARQSLEETRWLLDLAAATPEVIRAVVGWVPLHSPDLPAILTDLTHPKLRGLRHVIQAEAPGFMLSPEFARGIRAMRSTGLVYELLLRPDQLQEATHLVDAHPDQSFVLDHLGKPPIRHAEIQPWATHIRELARRPNTACKVSGMVTEAVWNAWTPHGMHPYLSTVLEAFGPNRLLAGSDWPVLCVAASYRRWWSVLREWVAPLSPSEQDAILGGTAVRLYSIPMIA